MTGIRCCFVSLAATIFISSATTVSAASITFDFGNANTSNNSQNGGDGNWIPFPDETTAISTGASTTIGGLTMSLLATAVDGNSTADDYWGINNQGIGVITDGVGGTNGRRIDGSIGEAISFRFDQDVTLTSLRLGSFSGNNVDGAEVATVTPDGGVPIVFSRSETTTIPTEDLSLGNVFVSAGTLVTLTTTSPIGSGVLFNEITVATVPEPAAVVLLAVVLAGVVCGCKQHFA